MSGRLTPEPPSRRDFLDLAGLWAAGVTITLSLVGMLRLAWPAVLPEKGRRFRIGRPEDFGTAGVHVVPNQKVLVIADERGVAGISLVCSHLGCVVAKTDTGFVCPCHGSAFDRDGRVIAGPAPRGLAWYDVSLAVDGRLVVDAAHEVAPGTFFRT